MHNVLPVEEINEDVPNPILKKIISIIILVFLLSLVVSYLLLGYPLSSILASNYESKIIKENTLNYGNVSIFFLEDSYLILKNHYLENEAVEIAACLKGYKDTNYFIEEIYFPKVVAQSVNQIIFNECSSNTMIILHSHPYKKCIASKQDILTLSEQKHKNNESLMIVMCSPNQFNIYG